MQKNRQLCIGLSLATTWLAGNGWRRPDSRAEEICLTDFYVDYAKKAEAARLDFLFRPDALFLKPDMLDQSPGLAGLDPTLLLATLARETSRIGLVTTASTTFNHPYHVARALQSLHWISRGRAGWNIVTALDGHENFGLDAMPGADARYDRAMEFCDLWRSYPKQARVVDRQSGRYVDRSLIQPIDHQGPCFRVKGPLNIPETDFGRIPFLQAGASDRGRDFAARVADAIFAATPDPDAGRELVSDIRRRVRGHGRDPHSVKVLPGLNLFLGRTRSEAQALYRDTHARQNLERKYAYIEEALGVDVRGMAPGQRLIPALLPEPDRPVRSRTHAALLRRLVIREQPTVAELLDRPEVIGSSHWLVVGTPEDAVDSILQRFNTGAADGFVALPSGSDASLHLFLDEVIPRLVELGVFRTDYSGTTFADHLGIPAGETRSRAGV